MGKADIKETILRAHELRQAKAEPMGKCPFHLMLPSCILAEYSGRAGIKKQFKNQIWIQQLKSWALNFSTAVPPAGNRVRRQGRNRGPTDYTKDSYAQSIFSQKKYVHILNKCSK